MAQILLDDGAVSIELSLPDKILSVHGSLRIPLSHITGAHVEDEHAWSHAWGKLVGTGAPGLKMAGTFWLNGGLAFVDYGSGKKCLVLDTSHETYKTIVVQPDPGDDAQQLANAINARIAR